MIRPVGQCIVARPINAEAKTKSGFLVPNTVAEELQTATAKVLAVGPATEGFKVGDEIIYRKYAISEVKLHDQDYVLVDQEDVLGVVEDGQ